MTGPACIVCGGATGPSRISGLLVCGSCRFVTADLSLSREQLEALYSAKYFTGEEYNNYVGERRLIEKQFRIRLETLLRYVPDAPHKHLFEIGSAYGFFLSVARDRFATVEGIDISRDAVAYAVETLRLPVTAGDFLDHPLQTKI